MIPSAERLAADDAHRLHGNDGLVDNTQRAGLDRGTQIGLHQLPIAEGSIHGGFKEPPAILAEFLGLVEREIRLDDHLVDSRAVDPG